MLGHDGNIVEELRELIAVPPRIERALSAFARAHPEEAYFVERTLMFRQAVLREFERLVSEGFPATEFTEVEEMKLGASTEALAFAQV